MARPSVQPHEIRLEQRPGLLSIYGFVPGNLWHLVKAFDLPKDAAVVIGGVFFFLLSKQVRSRRNREDMEQDSGERGCFTGAEGSAPPLDADISEK